MKRAFFILTLFVASTVFELTVYSSQDASNTVQIKVGDFYFKPGTVQLKAGQEVTIELVNEGKLEHEFMVGRDVMTEQGKHEMHGEMSKRFEKNFFDGIELVAQNNNGAEFMSVPGHGAMVALKPQGKATLTFKVPTDRKGEWIMACFMLGHYEAMMKGKVIVK
jgi:uncharacterized cupredoxin-like copper-binding protein